MTRTYAAKRLLEHGPLTLREFVEITGWKYRQCTRTLYQISVTGVARLEGRLWTLAEAHE